MCVNGGWGVGWTVELKLNREKKLQINTYNKKYTIVARYSHLFGVTARREIYSS